MGYSPNVLARALSKRKTNIIGLYFGYGHLEPHDSFHAEVLSGLQRGCAECDKDLMIHYSFHRYSVDEIFAELAGGKIDGLVLIARPSDPLVSRLLSSNLPVVAMTDIIPGAHCVVADDAGGSVSIAEHLFEKGHKVVLYRQCPGESDSAMRRFVAFESKAIGLGIRVVTGKTTDWKGAVEDSESDLIFRRHELGITAAVCWGDPSANALLSFCKQNGIPVPQELAVVGFNGIELPFEPAQRLTTVCAHWSLVAQKAVHQLVTRLEGSADVPMHTVIPVKFIPGETT
jgi:DNA-binding LacI/PurR family transcriptional regulator